MLYSRKQENCIPTWNMHQRKWQHFNPKLVYRIDIIFWYNPNSFSIKFWCLIVAWNDLNPADHKTTIEAENTQLILNFSSQLDQRLSTLQETVSGCVSKQHQLLRDMDERVCSFIGRKCEVYGPTLFCSLFCFIHFLTIVVQATQALEAKVVKIKNTYSSGVAIMKDLTRTLHDCTASNLEELKSAIISGKMAVENVRAIKSCRYCFAWLTWCEANSHCLIFFCW